MVTRSATGEELLCSLCTVLHGNRSHGYYRGRGTVEQVSGVANPFYLPAQECKSEEPVNRTRHVVLTFAPAG